VTSLPNKCGSFVHLICIAKPGYQNLHFTNEKMNFGEFKITEQVSGPTKIQILLRTPKGHAKKEEEEE
jgi:hypothetical protein